MKPQHFHEGELIFHRAVLGGADDDAARSGSVEHSRPQEEGSPMEDTTCTVELKIEGVNIRIAGTGGNGGTGGMESAGNVALDFSKLFKIASCVASCMLGSTAAASGAGTVADVKPGVGANAKPAK